MDYIGCSFKNYTREETYLVDSVADPYIYYTDPDPDPALFVIYGSGSGYPDPDPGYFMTQK